MIVETINLKEYHENGTLWIDEVRCYVDPSKIGLYGANLIKAFEDGRYFFRKSVVKHYDNGQFAWSIIRDELGNIINKGAAKYRKDGTGIIENR